MNWKKTDAGPDYINAEDFLRDGVWKEFTFTIKAVHAPNTVKAGDGKLINKPILEFEGTPKKYVLGAKENQRAIAYATGEGTNTAKWPGKKVTLYPVRGDFFGQRNVTALRVRVPDGLEANPYSNERKAGKVVDLTGMKQLKETTNA